MVIIAPGKPKVKSIRKMIFYSAVFAAGFIAVSLWSFWLVVRPPRIGTGLEPRHYSLAAEDVVIASRDGLKLSGWLIPRAEASIKGGSPRDKAALILLHGYPAEKGDMLDIAKKLNMQFTTLLMDMRYFGKSEGRYTTLGWKERDDLKEAVNFLEERGYGPVGVFGFSLGGAVGLMAAAEDSRIAAVAAYAPFSTLRRIGHDAYQRLWLLKYPLVELMIFWTRLVFAGDVTEVSPLKAAEKINVPVFLIHSREDEQIPFRHAGLFEKALSRNPRAGFYFFSRGRHGELPPDFEKRLAEFFEKSLQNSL